MHYIVVTRVRAILLHRHHKLATGSRLDHLSLDRHVPAHDARGATFQLHRRQLPSPLVLHPRVLEFLCSRLHILRDPGLQEKRGDTEDPSRRRPPILLLSSVHGAAGGYVPRRRLPTKQSSRGQEAYIPTRTVQHAYALHADCSGI